MELSLILSIIAIVVSVVLSTITLLLTEFRGPNITLVSPAAFEVNDETLARRISHPAHFVYAPRWFTIKSNPLVFANYGGKAGTILDLRLEFTPNRRMKKFFSSFNGGERLLPEGQEQLPAVIEGGDNLCVVLSPDFVTVNWKKASLAKALNTKSDVPNLIFKTMEDSESEFRNFCDFLDTVEEIGEISCVVTSTKGRFRTRTRDERIFKNIKVMNHYNTALSSLRACLNRWSELQPINSELFGNLVQDYKKIRQEMNDNLQILEKAIDKDNISQSRVKVENWHSLKQERDPERTKIRFYLIKSIEGLKEELTLLYKNLSSFNNSINELILLDELKTDKHYQMANNKRQELHLKVQKTCKRLPLKHPLIKKI